jgi:hypothetical protein
MDIVYLINKIKKLSVKEKSHILTILKKNNVPFTKNLNGYFFNLMNINDNVYDKINKCVDLIERNRELIESLEKKRELHIEYYKTLIENKLNERLNARIDDYYNTILLKEERNFIRIQKKCTIENKIIADPDILIKNYLKRFKYEKGSLYYKINQIMSKRKKKIIYSNSDEGGYSMVDMDSNYMSNYDELDETEPNPDDESLYNDDITQEDENIEREDNVEEGLEDEDIDQSQLDIDIEHDIENLSENELNGHDQNETILDDMLHLENKLEFYKNLLKQDGFVFDEDRHVKMRLQEYIS